jgi:hypothetical protein
MIKPMQRIAEPDRTPCLKVRGQGSVPPVARAKRSGIPLGVRKVGGALGRIEARG